MLLYISAGPVYQAVEYIYALGKRLDVIRTLSWYSLQNTLLGSGIAGMAGIQISC